jgi:hypothetical protein
MKKEAPILIAYMFLNTWCTGVTSALTNTVDLGERAVTSGHFLNRCLTRCVFMLKTFLKGTGVQFEETFFHQDGVRPHTANEM